MMSMDSLAWAFSRPIAHRGLHDKATLLLENTISAAQAAIAAGYGVECDIQLSSDGEAMVFHDHDLDRLTSATGPVYARKAGDLSRIKVGGCADPIPTLTAFLDAIGGRTPLVVEVKSRFDGDMQLVERLVEILAQRGGVDPVLIKSFDPDIIAHLRRIAPALPRGIVGQSRYDGGEVGSLSLERVRAMTDLLHWERTMPNFLSWRHADLPAAAPHLARLLGGVPVMAWTIRRNEDLASAYRYADQIVFEDVSPPASRDADLAHPVS